MTDRNITFGDFTISRTMPASATRLFQAFADKRLKQLWFKGPTDDGNGEHTLDFHEGGSELSRGSFHDGTVHTFQAQYYEIIPDERIIYTYEMHLGEQRISVSLATIEFQAVSNNSCQLTLHESGAFLDGFDKPEIRQQGTMQLLDALEASLKS
jgi:uncharacterized protein YndB with AHSA1/START domain